MWAIDLERSISSRFTFDASVTYNNSPAWSPDGRLVAFHQTRSRSDGGPATGVYQKASSGKSELLMDGGFTVADWSADGQYLAGYRGTRDVFDVWVMPLARDRKPFALMTTRFAEQEPAFSPDVRWIAYSSNESGQWQVFVEPFPATGDKFQISRNGGRWPTWRSDGKELFFLAPDGTMMATPLTGQDRFEAGVPQALFPTSLANQPPGQRHFAVSKDGQRFLINAVQQSANQRQITVVVNWTALLQQPR